LSNLVYNGGTFDLLHPGHLFLLRQCRALAGPGGQVVIGLNTDEFVEEFKGHRPVQSYLERSEVLASCRYVTRVIPNLGGRDSKPVLEAVAPDIIAVGADWYSKDDRRYCAQMGFTKAWLADQNITLRYLHWLPGHSSTNLRTAAREIA
jgi:cytidyltransferase-like protein